MTRIIQLEKSFPTDKLMGQFVDESFYDVLIQEDADVYKPRNPFDPQSGEHNLLLKFRKNVFDPKLVQTTYKHIRGAAKASFNRGTAAGPRDPHHKNRMWVSAHQKEIFDVFFDATSTKLFSHIPHFDPELHESSERIGEVWLKEKVIADGFNFGAWVEATNALRPDQQREAAKKTWFEYISDTRYANQVHSGIAGFVGSYPRIPYCRETSFNAEQFDHYKATIPFIEQVSEQFKLLTPQRYQAQLAAIEKLPKDFRVGDSVYTTITVNKNYKTACHTDSGDLTAGFGNLTVVSVPGKDHWEGAHLVFPGYRVAVNVRPGDMLAMQVHEPHANTTITSSDGKHERISLVCYFREDMVNCKTKKYEDLKKQFVLASKEAGKSLNGVFENMWASPEWKSVLLANDLKEMQPELFKDERTKSLMDAFV